jgi:DNA-binding response OmpR family regulator
MDKKITVIEDDEDLKNLVVMTLRSRGYKVEAQTDIKSVTEENARLSDLFIIDINLGSGISGLDICKQLKGEMRNRIPVIIITSAHPDLKQLAIDAYADDTLPKPFTSKELVAKVKQYLPG